ncbi:DUF6642 family protein [Nocardioides sp. NPDC092400]|uniref:DUF6642 family protein n=1 Tax=Nocardioides sp. NPDC092400 TaxID=3155196 RepID=UPI003414B35B
MRGVFCLEGDWDRDVQSRRSVEPVLELLSNCGELPYVHRDVATRAELDHYLDRWLTRDMAHFPIGYLGFHGSRRTLHLSEQEEITLEQFADTLDGRCQNRILYFGSCSTLAVDDEVLMGFCARTGARGIVGYTKDVSWAESAAFEILMLTDLLHASRIKSAYDRLRREHNQMTERLGLRMAHATWASDRALMSGASR